MNYDRILQEGVTIYSSGSSGQSKPYFQPPSKIKAANEVARKVQGITNNSKIYTVMKMTHAGGLFAQTLPGYEVGATIKIEPFNAYQFIREIRDYTHTIISPLHAKLVMQTKSFETMDFSGITISCGSEPVTWDIVEKFVSRNAKFIAVWGMSEIGPFAITHTFESMNEVRRVKEMCPPNVTILGNDKHCECKIDNQELVVKGDICIFDEWYPTKDKVIEIDKILFYSGRTNLGVDFSNPKKGM